jgi:hypothetical protein
LHWLGWLQCFACFLQRILQWWPHFVVVEVCIWLRKGYVGHRKNWWGYGCTTPPCLHWYTTVVTWRRRNSSRWCHKILLCTSFLGHRISFSYNPTLLFFFTGTRSPSSNQSSFPQEKVLTFLPKRGKFTLTTLKPPLSSSLIYFPFFIFKS